MAHVYILYSEKLNKHYIGCTSQDVDLRLKKHQESYFGSKSFTAKSDDWEVVLQVEVESMDHAMRIEKKIKSMKSSVFIKNLIKYSELRDKIIENTKNKN